MLLNAPPNVSTDLFVELSATVPISTVESVDDVCTLNVVSVEAVPMSIV